MQIRNWLSFAGAGSASSPARAVQGSSRRSRSDARLDHLALEDGIGHGGGQQVPPPPPSTVASPGVPEVATDTSEPGQSTTRGMDNLDKLPFITSTLKKDYNTSYEHACGGQGVGSGASTPASAAAAVLPRSDDPVTQPTPSRLQ
ncbi:unnamed protein product, partial [Meganyctiphanes norvegica]